MAGVTQRMLTRTLRKLERDGLISRIDHGEAPLHVEYEFTELGRGLLVHMIPLWTWVVDNADAFRAARDAFDRQRGAVVPAKGLATTSMRSGAQCGQIGSIDDRSSTLPDQRSPLEWERCRGQQPRG
jgi:DNA-binding MarR family transcriptional regulator